MEYMKYKNLNEPQTNRINGRILISDLAPRQKVAVMHQIPWSPAVILTQEEHYYYYYYYYYY